MNDFWARNWQWVFFAAFALLANLPAVWKWYRRRAAQEWPITQGRIEAVDVPSNEQKVFGLTLTNSSNRPIKAQVSYSYLWSGETFRGTHTRDFGREEEAWEFLRDLEGKPVEVHVNRSSPEQSQLEEKSLETVIAARAPEGPVRERKIPNWLRPLLWPLVAVALVGFILSAWVHVLAIGGKMPDSLAWGLHGGIFVVFLPAVLVAQKRVGSLNRKDYWKIVLQGAPEWMKYANYALLGYAMVNFFWCMRFLPTGHNQQATTPTMWRMFSGHWMTFYFAAFSVLYASIANQPLTGDGTVIIGPIGDHCANGHRMGRADAFCSTCGGPRAY